jgi:hypothetical protein
MHVVKGGKNEKIKKNVTYIMNKEIGREWRRKSMFS